MASDAYGPMGASLTFTTNINFHHTTFSSHPPTLLGTAPVIEFATFYSVQDGFWENLSKFASAMEGDEAGAEGVKGYVKGQVMEEIKREGKEDNGRAVVLCVGWESVEKHMAFRGTEIFKENVGLLRVLNGGPDLVSLMLLRVTSVQWANLWCRVMWLSRHMCSCIDSVVKLFKL